jgi:hypothetical protein
VPSARKEKTLNSFSGVLNQWRSIAWSVHEVDLPKFAVGNVSNRLRQAAISMLYVVSHSIPISALPVCY